MEDGRKQHKASSQAARRRRASAGGQVLRAALTTKTLEQTGHCLNRESDQRERCAIPLLQRANGALSAIATTCIRDQDLRPCVSGIFGPFSG